MSSSSFSITQGGINIYKNNIGYISSFIIIFFSTLHSIYFYQIKLAPLPIFAFLLMIYYTKLLSRNVLLISSIFYVILIANSIFGLFYAKADYYFNSLLGVVIGPIFFAFFHSLFKSNLEKLEKGLELTIVIHIIFFYIQFAAFYLLGIEVNYLQMITGEASRVEGTGVLTNLIRSSGLCNEPASYSLFVNLLCFYLISIQKRINWITILALFSCLLSFSVSGILFAILNIVYFNLFIVKGNGKLVVSIFLVTCMLFIFAYFYYDLLILFFESRFINAEEDASLNTRFSDGFNYFFNQNILKQITGIGIGNYPTYDISTVASGYMAIFVHLGYFFTILFVLNNLFCIRLLQYNKLLFIFFVFYLSSTMTYLNIHYWMFFAIGSLIKFEEVNLKS